MAPAPSSDSLRMLAPSLSFFFCCDIAIYRYRVRFDRPRAGIILEIIRARPGPPYEHAPIKQGSLWRAKRQEGESR